jgi:hypothetical protein
MKDYAAWARREHRRNTFDKRVQAIRCSSCKRLRQHPQQDDLRTWACGCGGIEFVNSFPHPDEEQLALKLYQREIEESGIYEKITQDMTRSWENEEIG